MMFNNLTFLILLYQTLNYNLDDDLMNLNLLDLGKFLLLFKEIRINRSFTQLSRY